MLTGSFMRSNTIDIADISSGRFITKARPIEKYTIQLHVPGHRLPKCRAAD